MGGEDNASSRPSRDWSPHALLTSALPWLYPSSSETALMQKDALIHYENLNFLPRKIPGVCPTLFGFQLRAAWAMSKSMFSENSIYFPLWNCRCNKARASPASLATQPMPCSAVLLFFSFFLFQTFLKVSKLNVKHGSKCHKSQSHY